jgi:hypothetical protein
MHNIREYRRLRDSGIATKPKLGAGGADYLNIDNSKRDKEREAAASSPKKKQYKAPSFRFERVFEVSALACGKVFSTQGSCHHSRKAS